MNSHSITIFTDGASRGNPGPGGWGAIVISKEKIYELGGREDHTTNNRMELKAAICALASLEQLNGREPITIFTDSRYLINGISKWISGWEKNGWQTKTKKLVLNRDLWEELSNLSKGKMLAWKYIGGHSGILGNERCDEIATSFADHQNIDLFEGPFESYPVKKILDVSETSPFKKSSHEKDNKGKAYSYLSLVDGKVETHKTWKECEERVKGVSNTKFKKASSPEEEKSILKEWEISS